MNREWNACVIPPFQLNIGKEVEAELHRLWYLVSHTLFAKGLN